MHDAHAFTFESATSANVEEYLAFQQLVAMPPWYFPTTEHELALKEIIEHEMLLVREHTILVACISFRIEAGGMIVHIADLAVLPSRRRRGIARIAMKHVLCELDEYPRVQLLVHVENIPARSLYRSLGFRSEDCWENYYEQGEHALLMVRCT